jgi:hypothetical protein
MLTGVILKAFTCNKLTKAPLYFRESTRNNALISNTGSVIPKTYCSQNNLSQFIAVSFPAISKEGELYLLSLLQLFRMQPDENILLRTLCPDRDSVVRVATRYGLEGPGIESGWQGDLPQFSRPALASAQLPVQWVPYLFTGSKAAGAWC